MTNNFSPQRWNIFAGYMVLTIGTQLAWFSNPIATAAAEGMDVKVSDIGILSIIFSGIYVLIGLPVGRFTDLHFSRSLTIGAALNITGAICRMIAPEEYFIQLLGQFILAVAQPFVINALTGLAARYFAESTRPMIISIGTAGMFLGMLLDSLTSFWLYQIRGLPAVVIAHGSVVILGGLWTILNLRTILPVNTPQEIQTTQGNLQWLKSNPFLWKLAGLMFIGFGIFSAFSTWFEVALIQRGIHDLEVAGIFSMMIVAGIIGMLTLPGIVNKRGYGRQALIVGFLMTIVMLLIILLEGHLYLIIASVILSGLFLLPCFPLALEWAEKNTALKDQGTAVGLLMIAGNMGALILTVLMGVFIDAGLEIPFLILVIVLGAGCLLASRLPHQVLNRETLGDL